MREYIAFDSHKRYTWVEREEVESGRLVHQRLAHAPGVIRSYLGQCEQGTAVAFCETAPVHRSIDDDGLLAHCSDIIEQDLC